MADEDQSQKTEDPTPKRLQKAREKGQVASSQEVKSWIILLGGTLGLVMLFPGLMREITGFGLRFIEQPHAISVGFSKLQSLLIDVVYAMAVAMLPMLLMLFFLALLSNFGQVGLIWAPEKIKPDFSKLDLLKGLKNKVSTQALVEFVKGIIKISIVATLSYLMAVPLLTDVALMPAMELGQLLERMWAISIRIAGATVGVMTVIAVLDFMYQKYSFTMKMRMSKQELKDEHKDSEGDPHVKARLRQLRMQRARRRMMAAVPDADVVVTNPTHYAVALKYDMINMPAPKLVAKGVDKVAERIRAIATDNDIPLIENPPLARALFAAVELDEEIPPEHYKAVAEVIGYVMRLKGKLPMH